MSDEKRYIVRAEPLPVAVAGTPTEEQRTIARARLDAADAISKHLAWTFVAARERGDRLQAHAAPPEGINQLDLKLADLASDILTVCMDFGWELQLCTPSEGTRISRADWTMQKAEAAISVAEKVIDFIAQPAFRWLSELLGAVALTARYCVEHGPEASQAFHVELQRRVVQFFDDLQRDVDLGADAKAWIDQKHKEIVEREEQKHA